MPYPVSNLLENRGKPVSATLTMPVTEALSLMLENDFSQLPVIDAEEIPLGLITYQEITRTLWYVDRPIEELRVEDAYGKVSKSQKVREDEDLFDILDELRDKNAVLVVDGDEHLIGIVTSYDATEYFRLRAEDMMHVKDIEGTIKDLILVAFTKLDGSTNNEKLQAAVTKVASANQPTKADYAKALARYLELSNGTKTNKKNLEQSYDEYLKQPAKVPEFKDLTLHNYIEILLHPDQNNFYNKIFPHSQDQIRKLLHGVRDTRNDLAHFREITPAQRDQLHYCKKLLEKIPMLIPVSGPFLISSDDKVAASEEPAVPISLIPASLSVTPVAKVVEILPVDEEASPSESKYMALVAALENTAQDSDQVKFTFDQINEILDGGLPPSARTHRAWWANDNVGHVQSQIWLDAGWRTSYINMSAETVVFARIQGLEKDYIRFYRALKTRLDKTKAPVKKHLSITGQSWLTTNQVPDPGPAAAVFGFSFARQRRFRVELYIDCGNKDKNKAIFDNLLAQKKSIEKAIGQELAWERIDKKQASRIALYHPGHINDPEDELAQLRDWAAASMQKFYDALIEPAQRAIKEVLGSFTASHS